jgi:DNA replication protein DnaC
VTEYERHGHLTAVGSALSGLARGSQHRVYTREEGDRIAPSAYEFTAEETAQFHREAAERYHLKNTPQLFAQAIADHPQVQDWAAHYLRNGIGSPWLLLLGDVGTGKTHQAYGALRYLAVSGWPTIQWRATTATALYARLRPGAENEFETEFATWATCPLLLLDDLGATRKTDFIEETTLRLVDDRHTAGLPMIVTSNLLPEEFAARFGKRTASRLRQACQVIDMGIKDRRRAPGTAA